MEEFKEKIDSWYDLHGESINHDTLVYYLTLLFEDFRDLDLQKADLEDIGTYLIDRVIIIYDNYMLKNTAEIILANKISFIFDRVNRNIKEIKDAVFEKNVNVVTDGDFYVNNTNEPDIDLRGIDLEKPEYSEDELLKTLGIKK